MAAPLKSLGSIELQTRRELILARLRQAISSGQLAPGTHLAEVELSEALGVSRGTLREALRHLQQEGLVTPGARGMLRVRSHTATEIRELFQVRAALEEHAARLATPKLCEDVRALQAEVDAMAAAAARNDMRAAVEHSERFHRLIVLASDNQLLHTMWSSLSITDHSALTMVTLMPDLASLAESHQPIVDAIASGDVELACRTSREHQDWFDEMLAARADGAPASATPMPA